MSFGTRSTLISVAHYEPSPVRNASHCIRNCALGGSIGFRPRCRITGKYGLTESGLRFKPPPSNDLGSSVYTTPNCGGRA